MAAEVKPELAVLIQNAYFTWLTTVRDDGMPQPTPVWFISIDDSFLIYSAPEAQKIRNIHQNPNVALGFTADLEANEYAVVMGTATLEQMPVPPHQVKTYLDKYTAGIEELGFTVDSFAARFSAVIRVTPERVRGE